MRLSQLYLKKDYAVKRQERIIRIHVIWKTEHTDACTRKTKKYIQVSRMYKSTETSISFYVIKHKH